MRLKILTVDDDPMIRKCIVVSFQSLPCDVLEAADGLEALTLIKQERPDLVLLDFLMPVMDGSETLARLKADPALRSIPVIVLTAEATRERVMKLLQQGVNDYILKPFRKDQIVERVGRLVDLKRGNREDATPKRLDEALQVLIVEDKPAIVEQIQQALTGMHWNVRSVAQPVLVLDQCTQELPDIILLSLSLARNGGFTLFQLLRSTVLTRDVPVLGLSVRTATNEHTRAEQLGFNGIIPKPITTQEVRATIASVLHLDTSSEYFEAQEGVLVLTLPAELGGSAIKSISGLFPSKLVEALDAGLNRVVVDLSQVEKADATLVRLVVRLMQRCRESQIPCGLVASKALCTECRNNEETKDWPLAPSFAEALTLLNDKALVMA